MIPDESRTTHRRVTRGDVAERAGVSSAVVSYVVNNGPRAVSDAARTRVLQAIDELGYRPDPLARALKTSRTMTLGMLVPDVANPYFAELAKAVEDLTIERGYSLLLANSSDETSRFARQLQTLQDRRIDGLFVIGAEADPQTALPTDLPTVVLDRDSGGVTRATVVIDNAGAAQEAVEHLLSHGHTTVFCLAGPAASPSALERRAGWENAMHGAGLHTAGLAVAGPYTREFGYEATKEILRAHPGEPVAIFCSADLQAVGALRACYELHRRVPEDVALFSFDGTQDSEYSSPPLSVVQQDIRAIAEAAVAQLLDGDPTESPRLVVDYSLVLRRSCGCGDV